MWQMGSIGMVRFRQETEANTLTVTRPPSAVICGSGSTSDSMIFSSLERGIGRRAEDRATFPILSLTKFSQGLHVQLYEMTWPDAQNLPRNTPIVIPVAALEQHGPHMPLFTDSLLLGEVVRRVEGELQETVLFTPLQWLGNSEHHLDFPGTMSASPRTYLDLLRDMVENFLFHGFDRIVILNGHGGNIIPSAQAMFELRQKYRDWRNLLLVSATYWDTAEPHQNEFEQPQMGHACEWETSMMMAIRPDLVKDHKGAGYIPFGKPFQPGHRAWVMKDRSEPGHVGNPTVASPEKGERLFQLFADGVGALLKRIVEWDGESWEG